MHTTHHAAARIQQRGIPPLVVDLLFEFGSNEPSGDGTSKLYFDKQARRKVKNYAGPLAGYLKQHLDVYAVVGADEELITVAHRYERIHRH